MGRRYFVDLFAGCGGLSLGLEQAGFTPILVNEISVDAMETYLRNRDERFPLLRQKYSVYDCYSLTRNDAALLMDLAVEFERDFGVRVFADELDLVVGGPPCQGYSRIGHRRSYAVPRWDIAANHLYLVMIDIIKLLRPKMFLFENVVGLTTARWTASGVKGEVWNDVLHAFRAIPGYKVEPAAVLAKQYGVPQNRPRVLIVGLREDIETPLMGSKAAEGLLPDFGEYDFPSVVDAIADLVDPQYENGCQTDSYPKPAMTCFQKRMRLDPPFDCVRGVGESVAEHKYSRHSPEVIRKFSTMIDPGDEPIDRYKTRKFAQRVLPKEWGPTGPNVTVMSLPDDYVHYEQPRSLTVREWARLQTFPDWYEFAGPRTTGGINRAGQPGNGNNHRVVPKYTQIGNAVPVDMARAIGQHLRKILDGESSTS